jgi:hypothetical protein
MEKTISLARVKGIGEVVEANTDFYNGLVALGKAGAHLITPRYEAKVRIATAGKKNIGRNCGTWTTAGFEYAKENLVLLRLQSRLMDLQLAKQAVEANRQSKYFSSDAQFYEESAKQAEKDKSEEPRKRKVLILPSRTTFQITPKKNMEVLEFLLRDSKLAKKYFEFNGSNPITTYLIDPNTVDAKNGTLMTQLWLYGLVVGSRSCLLGSGMYLDGGDGVRGVLPLTGEASSQKNSVYNLPYNKKQIDKYAQLVQGVRKGTLPASKLEQVAEFLTKLKQ